MSKLYACIVSPNMKRDREALLLIARRFSNSIEVGEDSILFDVTGLERLLGKRELLEQKIVEQLRQNDTAGSVAVAGTVDTAVLLARRQRIDDRSGDPSESIRQLPLQGLEIEQDTLNIFNSLGLYTVRDLLDIPPEELVGRYGREFQQVIDVIQQRGASLLKPNIRESRVYWGYELDLPVEDVEQLIFILNHGLDDLLGRVSHYGFSTEHLDISFKLNNRTTKDYSIKTSFPTLEKTFWLKLVNLRVSLDPPGSGIMSVNVTAHFTKPRPSQRGLYAVSRPEPESLLLTVNKLKKLAGEENIGVPVIVDQRLAEAFDLNAEGLPIGRERAGVRLEKPVIAFSYFHPPVRAEVLVRNGRLIFLKTSRFSDRVVEYSGVWRASSTWWDRSWKTHEWDVEVANNGIYRLCRTGSEWFLKGEYD